MRPAARIPVHAAILAMLIVLTLVACGGGGGGGGGVVSAPPFISLTTGQDAAVVIGQADFDSGTANQGGSPDTDTLNLPTGSPLAVNGALYVMDSGNNRALRYSSVPGVNDPEADLVLGHASFTDATSSVAANGLSGPTGISSSGTRLLVADTANNRVLIWNSLPGSSGANADVVVGQSDFGLSASACSADGLFQPRAAIATNGKLLVADSLNSRVLIWNTIPTTHGAPADLVLGQDAFDECQPNDLNQDGIANDASHPDAYTLFLPYDVWSDGTRIVVTEQANHRILIWSTFPTVSGTPADIVLGQAGMTTATPATGASGLAGPYKATSNGTQLFAADSGNNRVLVWNSFPTEIATPADVVLGQSTFAGASAGTAVDRFSTPSGVHAADNRLFVSDYGNSRVLIYAGQ